MRKLTSFLSLAGILLIHAQTDSDLEYKEQYEKALNRRIAIWGERYRQIKRDAPDEQKIEELGKVLIPVAELDNKANPLGHQRDAYDAYVKQVRDEILAIPDFAQLYKKRIEIASGKYEEAKLLRTSQGIYGSELQGNKNAELYFTCTVLSYIPHPETVRALGELLESDRGRVKLASDESNVEEVAFQNTDSRWAAETLLKILSDPPVPPEKGFTEHRDLQLWRKWYEQVKTGRRTFRLVNDPQIYSLAGPVSEAKNPDIPRDSKRPAIPDPAAISHPTADQKKSPIAFPTVPLILAALLLAAALAWLTWKYRQQVS